VRLFRMETWETWQKGTGVAFGAFNPLSPENRPSRGVDGHHTPISPHPLPAARTRPGRAWIPE
jgi:hypothetical protein